ncbi:GNAT family N-acetyltransferase [Vagococcus zengguangii]|uniref:GNAT family N-acetyltransferase n=2 Tax=Vagococcus zengguangii TaxID=2571750 RepID=A0A4D7CV59_9ENTE|nr:GNAT family N-acetyltransferase [Vagococcus zengguangii]TLG81845.1 GNAT family N-acetyltransferase [Vagococcus zengguangii]
MIREAMKCDGLALNEINEFALGYPCELELTNRLLSKVLMHPDHVLLVFELDQQVVGYVHAERYLTLYEEELYNLLGVAVHPDYQGQGIGGALLRAIENCAKDQGVAGVRLNSGSQRVKAHRFYENMGYDGNKLQKRFVKWFED